MCELFQERYNLQDTLNISVDESVAIFLIICGQNDIHCDIGLRFDHTHKRQYVENLMKFLAQWKE